MADFIDKELVLRVIKLLVLRSVTQWGFNYKGTDESSFADSHAPGTLAVRCALHLPKSDYNKLLSLLKRMEKDGAIRNKKSGSGVLLWWPADALEKLKGK